jgi:hypothetical protein
MKPSAPIETKVAASGLAGLVATGLLMAARQYWPGFHATPDTVSLLVTVVTLAVGYLAPHTSRPAPQGQVTTGTTQPASTPQLAQFTGETLTSPPFAAASQPTANPQPPDPTPPPAQGATP